MEKFKHILRSKLLILVCAGLAFVVNWWWIQTQFVQSKLETTTTGAPPYGEAESEVPDLDPWAWLKEWRRPDGPPQVGLQVGHWKNEELPDELERLRGSTGATGGGKAEWEVNYAIAELMAEELRTQGIVVDILPATVPEKYWADVFIALHADGNLNTTVTGYKIAGPWRDYTQKSDDLVQFLEAEYEPATKLVKDPNISRNMRGYYAFSWWRYDHAIHPMTTAVIVETGFLTNPHDRKIIVQQPEISASALSKGVVNFLESEGVFKSSN